MKSLLANAAGNVRPREGLKPNTPQPEAGIRLEPPPSFACALGTLPAATAAAHPPDAPDGATFLANKREPIDQRSFGHGDASFIRNGTPLNGPAAGGGGSSATVTIACSNGLSASIRSAQASRNSRAVSWFFATSSAWAVASRRVSSR